MRLIDADALMREFTGFVAPANRSDLEPPPTWNDAVSLLGSAPTIANVAPVVHGEWELLDGIEPRRYGCSLCKCLSWYGTYNYCPNCGAKMDGGVE